MEGKPASPPTLFGKLGLKISNFITGSGKKIKGGVNKRMLK
jgi:hypothetical protein